MIRGHTISASERNGLITTNTLRGRYRERFLSYIVIDLQGPRPVDEAPCWLWTGWKAGGNSLGGPGQYGCFSGPGRKKLYAHRVAYELWYGPIPDGLVIDHMCRVPACCNPAHLEAVTMRENNLRGVGWSGRNGSKTECKRGHEFTDANTYISRRGQRQCRECLRAKGRARRPAKPKVPAKCGTLAGFSRHRREGTPACPECREAIRAYWRSRYTPRSAA